MADIINFPDFADEKVSEKYHQLFNFITKGWELKEVDEGKIFMGDVFENLLRLQAMTHDLAQAIINWVVTKGGFKGLSAENLTTDKMYEFWKEVGLTHEELKKLGLVRLDKIPIPECPVCNEKLFCPRCGSAEQ
jgi:hypothetical protein